VGGLFAEARHPGCEAVPVTEIDVVDARAGVRQHADRPAVDRDETREAAG
jgi:hypothetical protein